MSLRFSWFSALAVACAFTSAACPTRTVYYPDGAADGGASGSAGAAGQAGSSAEGQAGSAAGGQAGAAGQPGSSASGGHGGSGDGGRAGSGAGGIGGSDVPQALGAPCARSSECASGFCAGGTCCDSACNGLCEQCSPAGTCEAADDDPSCGTITCPTDTPCTDYEPAITAHRCASRGSCKTQRDCAASAVPEQTYCGGTASSPLLCDGRGFCDEQPVVRCGGNSSCLAAPGACCYDGSGATPNTVCVQDPSTCKPANTASACSLVVAQCDSPRDCPPEDVCCYVCGLGFPNATASCMTAQACDQNSPVRRPP
jgi:hypothetical protein